MPGHEDPKGHVEIKNGKAVLVMDEKIVVEQVKAEPIPIKEIKKIFKKEKK